MDVDVLVDWERQLGARDGVLGKFKEIAATNDGLPSIGYFQQTHFHSPAAASTFSTDCSFSWKCHQGVNSI